MPIVRLISPSADDARPVIEQLRALGYTVETLAPGESSDRHADLEISLEKHPVETVLKRAAELAAGEMDVYIGAGTFPARSKPAIGPPPIVPTIADTVSGVARGLRNKRDLMAKALREQRATMRRARQKVSELSDVSEVVTPTAEVSAVSKASINPAPVAEIPSVCRSERSEEPLSPQTLPELPPVVSEVARQGSEVIEVPLPAALDAVAQPEVEAEAPAEHKVQEFAEPAEILRPTEPKPALPVEPVPAAAAPEAPAPGVEHRSTRRPRRVVVAPRGRRLSRAKQWRIAVASSVIFAAILMVIWKRVTEGPVSPLSPSMTQSNVEEQVPFGAVTLRPTAAAGQVTNPHQQPSPSTTANGPHSAKPSAAPKPSATKDTRRTASKPAAKPHRPEPSAGGAVAEDVVVRHFGPKPAAQKPKPKPENATMKRYSDLDY